MPRLRRHWCPGFGAHVISRFVDRDKWLLDAADRRRCLQAIGIAHARWDWRWLSYALMSTHLHYGLLAGESAPGGFFRSCHQRIAGGCGARRSTLGPIFADRPTIATIDTRHLARLVAYHHRNPVDAGIVDHPAASRWTSHRAYMGLDPAPPWLDVSGNLKLLGFSDSSRGRRRFEAFVCEVDFESESAGAIRVDDSFAISRERDALTEAEWAKLVATVLRVCECSSLRGRGHRPVFARSIAAYVSVELLGANRHFVAERLGTKVTALSVLVSRRRREPPRGFHVAVSKVLELYRKC